MTPSEQLQRELEGMTVRSRENIEALIAEAHANAEAYERLKWYVAAECSAAGSVQRLLDYREEVMRSVVQRLAPQLPAPAPAPVLEPVQPQSVAPAFNGYAPHQPPPRAYQDTPTTSSPGHSYNAQVDGQSGYDEATIRDVLRNMQRDRRYG
jgi:hypothetical protein